MATVAALRNKTWTKDQFLISTDPGLIPLAKINAFFASDAAYWASPLPEAELQSAIDNSLCFGLYKEPAEMVGFARIVTDFTTISFLTDVWVDAAYQGHGLGKWLVGCVRECVEGMPHLRRTMLLASWERAVPFYQETMGMRTIGNREGEGVAVMELPGPGDVLGTKKHAS